MTKAETSTKTSDAFSPVHSPPDLPLAPLSPPDSVHELVIDRRSLSHADISFMRLRGCRVRAHGSPAPQRCWDTSVSSVPPGAPAASLSGSLCPLVRPAEPEDDDEAERTDSAVPATSFTPSAEDAALGSPFSCVALVHPLSVWKFPVLGEKESPACTALCVAGEEPAAMAPQSVPAACSVLSPLAAGSFSELQASLRYVYRMANVYAIHEALAGQTHETVSPSVQPLSSATPHGYYSLGSRRSMHHTNKRVVSAVPQVLQGLNLRNSSENGQRLSLTQFAVHHRHQMDSAVLAQLEQRPLLQTTLFAEFNYRSLTGKRKSLGMFSLTDEALGHIEKCTRQSPKEMPQETGMHSETLAGKASPPILDTSFVSGAAGSPRRLTEVRVWNQKTHGIDGISRCVDNEEDSLVVYVGMILMGWLEVVDLLGSGTFGQVFLCKDLRISGPHFVHPNMIDGEDFQYWQYSHDYIPFSDPSLPPKSDPLVAVKVVRSQDLFDQQSVLEAEMLIFVGAQTSRETGVDDAMRDGAEEEVGRSQAMGSEPSSNDPPAEDPRCASVAKIYAHGVCYGHHCIVLKRYGANLFEYIQSRDFKGLPMYHLQDIGRQILRALTLLHDTCGVVHCDVKPENVLLSLDLSTSFASPTDAELCGASCSAASSGEIGGSVVMLSGRGRRGEGAAHARNSTTINTSTGRRTWNANSSTAADGPAKENNSPSSMTPLLPLPRRMHHLSGGAVPSLRVKLIDFSSSAYKNECIYTYVQSRYYRAPEVILGAGYGPPIDLWSTGCLLAELLLGLPLLSGSSDYHQLYLMEEMLGALPSELLEKGKQTWRFFDICTEGIDRGEESAAGANGNSLDASSRGAARTRYHFLSEETFRARHGGPPVEWSKYFRYRTLRELAQKCILSEEERRLAAGRSPCGAGAPDAAAEAAQPQVKEIIDEMVRQRFLLYDVLCKMLKGNPAERITAREALEHPFFSEVPKYIMPYLSDMKGKSLFSV